MYSAELLFIFCWDGRHMFWMITRWIYLLVRFWLATKHQPRSTVLSGQLASQKGTERIVAAWLAHQNGSARCLTMFFAGFPDGGCATELRIRTVASVAPGAVVCLSIHARHRRHGTELHGRCDRDSSGMLLFVEFKTFSYDDAPPCIAWCRDADEEDREV